MAMQNPRSHCINNLNTFLVRRKAFESPSEY